MKIHREIESAKRKLTKKAIELGGVYENFGQDELREIKDKHDFYSDNVSYYDRLEMFRALDGFDNWCTEFCATFHLKYSKK